ncbi:hypothetical protein GH714_040955 [Hevea brasiliensis]|uniref:CCHC-type domain-containing protein n=1 Tax=Hevea brasiliensis TaxID=3981 RepID=A0A6A6MIX5_HEVBR|nr:hypothetical protein GH714_040955 [Hevea brasiliensis]
MTDSQNSSHSSDSVGTVTHACNSSEDISLPYYLHHSKDYSSVIVTPELTSANFASWRRSVSPPIASNVFYMEDAKQIWEKLNKRLSYPDDLESVIFSSFCALVLKSQSFPEMFAMAMKKVKNDVTCFHCGKPGHVKANCYRLIGFPPDFKFTKSKGNVGGLSSSKPTSAYQVSTTKAIVESVVDDLSQITLSKDKFTNL